MFFRYGSYDFDLGASGVTIDKASVVNDFGEQIAVRESWRVEARLKVTSGSDLQASLNTKIAALEAALGDGKSFGLILNNGSQSDHWINNADCLGGTRVLDVSYPTARAEFVSYRTVSFTLEAVVPVTNATRAIISFTESIKRSGGGPDVGYLETLIGRPVAQTKRRRTVFRAVQSGQAVGYLREPLAPPPIWPAALVPRLTNTEQITPEQTRGDFHHFGIRWEYHFESDRDLKGRPRRGTVV